MILDFKEIPQANKGTGEQDSFELFCRDLFSALDYPIIENPSRGADGKKDLIIQENFYSPITGNYTKKYIVSCKHLAPSGKSVKADSDEPNILSRIQRNDCDGFIGFYSTLPSSSLNIEIQNYVNNPLYRNLSFNIYDREKIESLVTENITNNKVELIFKRYFPKSYKAWMHSWHKLSQNDFEQTVNNDKVKEFYIGLPPSWRIVNDFTFRRDAFVKLIQVLEKNNICLITGAGGEGKSTFLMQIGVHYFNTFNYDVYYNDNPNDSIEIIFDYLKNKNNTLLLIDNANYSDKLVLFIQKVYLSNNIKLVLATRKNEWNAFLQMSKDSLIIKKYLIDSEIELGKLSKNELIELKKLLVKQDIISISTDIVIEQDRNFLLATMIAYTQGKPLKMILSDVVEKISNFTNKGFSEKAILALGIIVYMEHLPGINNKGIYCNDKMLFDILEVSRFDFMKIIDLIKGEAFIQPTKTHFITRNPIITDIFYSILYSENENRYLLEEDIVYSILKVCSAKRKDFDNFILSYIPQYYLKNGNIEFAKRLFEFVLTCGIFPESYNDILQEEIKQTDISETFSYNHFIERMKNLYYKDTTNYKLLTYWAKKEFEKKNFGAYELPFSCRWLFKQAYLLNPTFKEIYQLWSKLEKMCDNIGDVETENSVIWILNQSMIQAHDGASSREWANIEIEKKNFGDIKTPNSAIWILSKGIEKTNDASLYLSLANIEIEEKKLGDTKTPNSAILILSKGIEKTNDASLYLSWANIEIEEENLGDTKTPDSAIWILSKGIEKTNDACLYLSWANIEIEKKNLGDTKTPDSAIWILAKGIEMTNDQSLFPLMAYLEFRINNYGGINEKNSVRWLYYTHTTSFASITPIYSYIKWSVVEYYLKNKGDNTIKYSATYLINKAFEKSRFNYIEFWGLKFFSVDEFENYIIKYIEDNKTVVGLLGKVGNE
jgi:hypothetical protein